MTFSVLHVPEGTTLPCRNENPAKWFPETETGRESSSIEALEEAKQICRRCPLVSECLLVALTNDEPYGVWGGLSAEERQALRKEMRRRGWFKSAA